jgi:hypothetical protein
VACFLTRGDLWQSWEHGARIFDKLLLDGDWALNNGNWQWLSCSAFFHQYFRVYSPVAFPKKTDKSGAYVRKWLPQFKDFPEKYIYEPWLAPLSVQRAHGCVVGESYPARIVVHETASKANMGRMAEAFDMGKAGQSAVQTGRAAVMAKGVGGSAMGCSLASVEAWRLAWGVQLGLLPAGGGGGGAAAAAAAAAVAAPSGAAAAAAAAAGGGKKRRQQQQHEEEEEEEEEEEVEVVEEKEEEEAHGAASSSASKKGRR